MKINHREYRGERDDQRIRELLSQNYAATRHPYYTADPANWERIRAAKSGRLRIQLWELADRPPHTPVALVLYQKHQGEFSYLVHPN